MDRGLQGAYGRDYLKHRPSRDQEDRKRAKDLRGSPSPHRELKPVRSLSPVSHNTLSHKELTKPSERTLTPAQGEFKDTTLNNYFWMQDAVVETAATVLTGKRPSLGPKVVAAVQEHAEYYESELKKELGLLVESEGEEVAKHSLPLLPRREEITVPASGFFTPTYSYEPPVDIPRLKNDTLKKVGRKDKGSDFKPAGTKALPSIRESKDAFPRTPSRRLYRLKAALPLKLSNLPVHDEEEASRKEQQLEASIQELDERLLRLRKKQSLRSVSVFKDKSKGRQERYLPRLKLPPM